MPTQVPREEEKHTRELEIAYIAGLMDGEGYFGIKTQSHIHPNCRDQLVCSIWMTDKDPVERVAAAFPAKRGKVRYDAPRSSKHKGGYRYQLNGNEAASLMLAILPFVSKRRAAKIQACLDTPNLAHLPKEALSDAAA